MQHIHVYHTYFDHLCTSCLIMTCTYTQSRVIGSVEVTYNCCAQVEYIISKLEPYFVPT